MISILISLLWPSFLIGLSFIVKHGLREYYSYKQLKVKLIESASLQDELETIRASHKALEQSVSTVNQQLGSLQTMLNMTGKVSKYV